MKKSTKLKLSSKVLFIIVTAVGAALGAAMTYIGLQWHKQETLENRYTATLNDLLQPRKDGEPNSSNFTNLLKNLDALIQQKSQGDETSRKNLREDAARRFAELFKSHSFDWSQGANVEFETTVLDNWTEYSDHLSETPRDNVWIMYQYSLALKSLGQKEPALVQSALPQTDDGMKYLGEPNDKNAPTLLEKLNVGYRMHVDLLRKQSGDINREYLLNSFCWYHNAIDNPYLVEFVFRYDKTQVRSEQLRCNEAGQSMRLLS